MSCPWLCLLLLALCIDDHSYLCEHLQVKAATGEEVSAENLGGADLHCR